MAVEITLRLTGGTGNTSPLASIGGAMSTDVNGVIADNSTNNLWDDASAGEAAAGDLEYRCIAVQNAGDVTADVPVLWFADQGTGVTGASLAVGLDGAAVGATPTSSSTTPGEGTAPSPTVTFIAPVTQGAGLALPDLPAGQAQLVWLRRTVTAGAAGGLDVPVVVIATSSPDALYPGDSLYPSATLYPF